MAHEHGDKSTATIIYNSAPARERRGVIASEKLSIYDYIEYTVFDTKGNDPSLTVHYTEYSFIIDSPWYSTHTMRHADANIL